jgi:hypothetical protein
MTISKRTELAKEQRKLRRLREDEPAFSARISAMTDAEQKKARERFQFMLGRQQQNVETLEAELTKDR